MVPYIQYRQNPTWRYIFEFWIGDHPPRHVHILSDRKLIAKVELDEEHTVMEGKISRRLLRVI